MHISIQTMKHYLVNLKCNHESYSKFIILINLVHEKGDDEDGC